MPLISAEMRVKKRKKNLSTISIIYPHFSTLINYINENQ